MKKIISAALAAVMSLLTTAAVTAANNNPKVYIDNAEIIFADQEAVIKDDRTLVPARGVFEAMDAYVQWDAEKRRVQIDSSNSVTRVYLTIDNPVMEVYTFTSIFSSDKKEVDLEVVPQIMNDRTMIPFRAIADAMGCDVEWSEEDYAVFVTTEEGAAPTDGKLKLSMSASADTVKADETVDVLLSVENLGEGEIVSGVSAVVEYSKEDFEFVSSELFYENEKVGGLEVTNPDFTDNALKTSVITTEESITTDGTVLKLTFKAKTEAKADFRLAKLFDSLHGYHTRLIISKDGVSDDVGGNDLVIDTSAVTVNDAE